LLKLGNYIEDEENISNNHYVKSLSMTDEQTRNIIHKISVNFSDLRQVSSLFLAGLTANQ
jgi:hypothetical protein